MGVLPLEGRGHGFIGAASGVTVTGGTDVAGIDATLTG